MDIKGAEIFATGKWNGIDFNEKDLDDIVANFESLGEVHHVPLKLGHNKEQKIVDGQPALGWVKRIYRQGQKLLADFKDMPKVIHDAVQRRLYRTVSIELLFNVDHDGNKYNQVLDAVALLGADHPAVNTLADLQTLTAMRTEFSGGRRVSFETMAGNQPMEENMGISEEDFKKLQASVDGLVSKIDEKDSEINDLKSKLELAERDKADFTRKQEEEKVENHRLAIIDVFNTAVKARKITPAFREVYSKQIGLDDDEKVLAINLEDVKKMCEFSRSVDDEETGLGGRHETHENAEAELLQLTRENREPGETFEAAFMRTAEAHPTLHREYLDMNGEV